MGFDGTHDAIDSYPRLARFERHPYTGGNRIQAVAETLVDIEQDRAIFGVRGPNLRRNSPCHVLVSVHLLPPGDEWPLANTRRTELGVPRWTRIYIDFLTALSWA